MTLRHPTMQELLSPSRPAWHSGGPARRPVVTISRLPGAGGRALAQELARRFDVEVHDRDIVHRIALKAGLGDRNVTGLEKDPDHSLLVEWLASFAGDAHLSAYGYLQHLTRTVEEIARPGGAVILGRGAHLILPPGTALRVFVVAPLPARIAAVVARHGVTAHEAELRVRATEAERRAFLRHYFHAELDDPAQYDMVVNMVQLGVRGAADAVAACLIPASVAAHA